MLHKRHHIRRNPHKDITFGEKLARLAVSTMQDELYKINPKSINAVKDKLLKLAQNDKFWTSLEELGKLTKETQKLIQNL